MQRLFTKIKLSVVCLAFAGVANAQMLTMPAMDSASDFKPTGRIWGYAFGDYAYKGGADVPVGGGAYRDAANQYNGMAANASQFQFRRVYLGYNYDISPKFTAEFLLASEDDFNSSLSNTTSTGDVLSDGKFAPYVKYANLKWKNIFKNSDLKIGQQATPSFAKTDRNEQTAEEVWGYRAIERTISDIRRTPSFDMGASLQGWFNNSGTFGYMIMVGNGSSAKPDASTFKQFTGDIFAKFMNKRLVMDLFQDYQKLNWGVFVKGPNGAQYADRNMTKLFVAWNTPKLTVGFEGFQNTICGGIKVSGNDKNTYYRTLHAMGTSFYVRGRILSASNGDPKLNFFARYDNYDPSGNLSNIVDEPEFNKAGGTYSAVVSNYDPTTKEQFVTMGIDWMPVKNVHFMPNIWLNTYASSLSSTGMNNNKVMYNTMNTQIAPGTGEDLVYRLTFYYVYNPKKGTTVY